MRASLLGVAKCRYCIHHFSQFIFGILSSKACPNRVSCLFNYDDLLFIYFPFIPQFKYRKSSIKPPPLSNKPPLFRGGKLISPPLY